MEWIIIFFPAFLKYKSHCCFLLSVLLSVSQYFLLYLFETTLNCKLDPSIIIDIFLSDI